MLQALNITVPAASVQAALTGFPLYIDLATLPAAFWAGLAFSDGRDIRVFDQGGANIPFDLVYIDPGTKTGSLFCKLASLSNLTPTIITVQFGDATAQTVSVTAPGGRNAVWSDYTRVFFFGGASGPYADHTGQGSLSLLSQSAEAGSFSKTAESPQLSSHEGIAWDGTYFYTTDLGTIRKWDSNFNLLATNSSALTQIGGGVDHLGDLEVVGGILYIPCEHYDAGTNTYAYQHIARFNANDLSFIGSTDVSVTAGEVSSICYVPEEDMLYVSNYVDSSKLYKYARADLSFQGTVTFAGTSVSMLQGITYWRGSFWLVQGPTGSPGTTAIYQATRAGMVLGQVYRSPTAFNIAEGITHTATELWVLNSFNVGNGTAWKLTPEALEGGEGFRLSSDNGLLSDSSVPAYTVWTMGITAKLSAAGQNRSFISYGVSGSNDSSRRTTIAYRSISNQLGVWDSSNAWQFATTAPAVGTRCRLHAVYNNTTWRKLYYEGTAQATGSGIVAAPASGANALYVGVNDASDTEAMAGDIGFVYLRSGALSDQWLAAEVSNLRSPASFYMVSAVYAVAPPPPPSNGGGVYEKSWQFDMNRAFVAPSVAAIGQYTLWYYKAFLTGQVGGATQGLWTVAGSSDGATGAMDGVDRWTDWTKVTLYSSVVSTSRAWVVLKSPLMLGQRYWILLMWDNMVPGSYDYSLTMKMDIQAPTGGSNTAAPTMATANVPYTSYNPFTISPAYSAVRTGGIKMHGQLATDGSFHVFMSRDFCQGIVSGFIGTLLGNTKAADQFPFWVTLGADQVVSNQMSSYGQSTCLDAVSWMMMRSPNGQAQVQYAVPIRPIKNNIPDGPDNYDGAWPAFPMWVGDNSTAANRYRTVRGRIQDIMWCPGGPDFGSKYLLQNGTVDNRANPMWMVVGDHWFPTNAVPLL